MKKAQKVISLLLTLLLCLGVMAGCQPATQSDPGGTTAGGVTPDKSSPKETTAAPKETTAAPQETTKGTDPEPEKILNLAWHSATGTDAMMESPFSDTQSLYHMFIWDSLVKLEDGLTRAVPMLAESFEFRDDGMALKFVLRDDVKWQDGEAFTADDVVFTLKLAGKLPKSTHKPIIRSIKGGEEFIDGKADEIEGVTANGNTITLDLVIKDLTILNKFASVPIMPVHLLGKADLAEADKYTDFWKHPIGTGAYRIDEIKYPDYFTMVRNENYWGTPGGFDKALFKSYQAGGAETQFAALISGELDLAYGNEINDISAAQNTVRQNDKLKIQMANDVNYRRCFVFNMVGGTDDKYNDIVRKPEVRQALNLLIDRESIAAFYPEQGLAMTTQLSPTSHLYNKDIPEFKRDVDKARQMLEEADFDFNKPLRLLYYYDDQTSADVMEVVTQNFAEAGVKLEPFLAKGDLSAIIYEQKNWDMLYGAFSSNDPVLNYSVLATTEGSLAYLGTDPTYYDRKPYADLFNEYFATATDPESVKKVCDQLQVLAAQDSFLLTIYGLRMLFIYNADKLVVSQNIMNDLPTAFASHPHLEDWKLK